MSATLVLSTVIMPVNVAFGAEFDSGMTMQSEIVQEGNITGDGENDFRWSLDAEGTLVINGQGALQWDTHDFSETEEIASKVKKLVLGEGVTQIWFSENFNFPELIELSLPITLEVLDTSYYRSGGFCPKLETITGGDNVTFVGVKIIEKTPWVNSQGEEAIIGNTIVKYNGTAASYTTPNGVKTISPRAFAENAHLESVNLSDSITHISNEAFVDCKALSNVTGGKNLESVAYNAFSGTPWEAAQEDALIIENTLEYYLGTASDYVVPETVERILPNSFVTQGPAGEQTLKTIEFTGEIKEIPAGVFCECYGLTTVVLPESVIHIGEDAFAYSGLQEVIGGNNISSVELDAFRETPWLEKQGGAVILGKTLFNYEGTAADYVVPETVEKLGYNVFSYNENLESIEFRGNITEIPDLAFSECTNLRKVVLPASVKRLSLIHI